MAKLSALARVRDFLSQDGPSPALLDPCRYNPEHLLEHLRPDLHIEDLMRAPPKGGRARTVPLSGPKINLTSFAEAMKGHEKDPASYNLALAMRWEEDRRSRGFEPMFRYFSPEDAKEILSMRSGIKWRKGGLKPDWDHLVLIVEEEDGSYSHFNLNPSMSVEHNPLEGDITMARQNIEELVKKHLNGAYSYFYVDNPEMDEDEVAKFYVRDFLTYSDGIERRMEEGASRQIRDLEKYLEDTLPYQFYDAVESLSFTLKDIYQHMLSLCGRAKPVEDTPSKQVAEWIAKMVPCQPTGKAERSIEEMWTIFTETIGVAKKEEVVRLLEGFKTSPGLGVGEYGFLRINKVAGKGGSSPDPAQRKSGSGAR